MIKSFRDLRVWQEGMQLDSAAYLVAGSLRTEERFALGAQLRRASVSIVANIAEGHGRPRSTVHRNDYRRFIAIALGSCAELETLLAVARHERLSDEGAISAAEQQAATVGRMLRKLHQSLAPDRWEPGR